MTDDILYLQHEDICRFPSWKFYDDQLKTPAEVINRIQLGKSLWRSLRSGSNKPKCFVNVEGWEGINPVAEKSKGGEESKFNTKEVECVVKIIKCPLCDRLQTCSYIYINRLL